MMTLEDEITEAQVCITEPPKNESNTCDWIILPLLYAAGYARRDIESRVADSTGQFPDYTLLPNNSSATYYLEAKAWNVTLEDIHAKQALNYANHNGKRFVVLTNGQNWRLYDNAIQGQLAEKLLTQAVLRDTTQITDFLTVLSKSEVLNGSLERKAEEIRQCRLQEDQDRLEQQKREEQLKRIQNRQTEIQNLLSSTLPELLRDLEGDLVVLITDYLSKKDEFSDISPEILAAWFGENLSSPSNDIDEPAISNYVQTPPSSKRQGRSTWTLKELQGRSVDGKKSKPIAFRTPDRDEVMVRSWVDLAENLVRWLLQQPRLMPLPFESSSRTRWFLNSVPEHKRPDQRKKFKAISSHGKTVYMDADRSGGMFLNDVYALCLAMQIDPDAVQIAML